MDEATYVYDVIESGGYPTLRVLLVDSASESGATLRVHHLLSGVPVETFDVAAAAVSSNPLDAIDDYIDRTSERLCRLRTETRHLTWVIQELEIQRPKYVNGIPTEGNAR